MTNQDDEAVKTIDPAQQLEVCGRLKAIITDCRTTQTEFAALVGYKSAYINHIANGIKPLSGAFLYNFAKNFGTVYDIHWLLTGIGDMKIGDLPRTMPEQVSDLPERMERLEAMMKEVIAKIEVN